MAHERRWDTSQGVLMIAADLCEFGWLQCATYEGVYDLAAKSVPLDDARWVPFYATVQIAARRQFDETLRLYPDPGAAFVAESADPKFTLAQGPHFEANQAKIAAEVAKLRAPLPN
jgi:hypothetical protein